MTILPGLCIDEESKPKSLQHPEDHPFGSIEKTEREEESVDKQNQCRTKGGIQLYFERRKRFRSAGLPRASGFNRPSEDSASSSATSASAQRL